MSAETAALPRASGDVDAQRRRLTVSVPGFGLLWFGGWLFTIGFAHVAFWKAVLALVVWPYFLGVLAR